MAEIIKDILYLVPPDGAWEVLALAVRNEEYRNAPGAGWLEVIENPGAASSFAQRL